MARGMANNEPTVSQANTEAFDEGYDRIFGAGRKAARGTWIVDKATGELVDAADYVPPSQAKDAPICAGRFYEGAVSPIDGTDIGSRQKHRAYMREKGLTTIDDFNAPGGQWDRAEKQREAPFSTPEQRRERREKLDREMHRVANMPQAKYDKEVAQRQRERRERGPVAPTHE